MQSPFRARLESGRVLLADGAMGTQLFDRGVGYDECLDAQTVEQSELVEQIHRDYIMAGAELIETNTFGANRIRLGVYGLEDRVHEINRRAPRLARAAREICGEMVFVAASVGPTGRALQPFGNTSAEEVYDVFYEQISALLEGGPDLLVFETFSDLAEITEGIRAAQDLSDLPIVAQMTFDEELRTPQGHSPEQVADVLGSLGVDAIGANCSVGSNALLAITDRFVAAGVPRVAVMPNAGYPTSMGNRVVYHSSPEYMAEHARRMAELGAAIVGGCCGTTPAHIRAMKYALGGAHQTSAHVEVVRSPPIEQDSAAAVDVSGLSSRFGQKRLISVEVSPPRGANPRKALQGAKLLRDAGVDAVNVFDSAMARVRMSSMATAIMIKQQLRMEAIVHFTTRDRNLMAIQSDLIGGHALGIRTVLALTGDPPPLSSQGQYKAVYDIDSAGLIRIIKQLNQGVDTAGNSIGTPTHFLVGCALNPTAEDLEWELDKFHRKVEAGADFVMTQPVYDAELFRRVLDAIRPIDMPILMGVLPLQNHRHALFIHNELPGVTITPEALDRMERAGADGIQEGIRMTHELIDACGHLTSGIYIIPSFGRYEMAARLVSELLDAA